MAHQGDPTRMAIDAARPLLARSRVRRFARFVVAAIAWLVRRPLRAVPRLGRDSRREPGVSATSSALERYEAVIGIEVHCQVRTASKMFCACAVPGPGRRAEHPHLPGLPRAARRAADHQPGRRGARPHDRARDRGDGARRHPLGSQELLLPRPPEGLPDQPVRPPAGVAGVADRRHVGGARADRHHAGPPRGGHRQAGPRRGPAGHAGQPRRLQPGRRAADGDRHGARDPERRAGAALRGGAAAPAPDDRRVGRGDGERPDAGRGERLAPARAGPSRSGPGSRSRT